MLNVRTHRLYERWIPASRRTGTDGASVIALKAETVDVFSSRHIFIDAIIGADGWLQVLPFLEFVSDPEPSIVCPAVIARAFPVLCGAVGEIAKNWFVNKGQPADAVMDFFVNEPALGDLFRTDDPSDLPAFPGVATMNTLGRVASRYARAALYAAQPRCVDLNAGLGFGSFALGASKSIECVNASPLHRNVAARMGIDVHEFPLHASYDLVLALDVPLDDADEWIQRARALCGRDGRAVVSVRGDALDRYARDASRTELLAIAADAQIPQSQETFLVFDNRTQARRIDRPKPTPVSVLPSALSVWLLPGPTAAATGDDETARCLAESLRQRGHRVAVGLESGGAGECEIIHVLGAQRSCDALDRARALSPSAAVVVTPDFSDEADEAIWGRTAAMWAYSAARDEKELASNVQRIAGRSVAVNEFRPPPARMDPSSEELQTLRKLLDGADLLLAKALSEVHRIYRHVDLRVPFGIVPALVDAGPYGRHVRERFVRSFALENFLLMTGPLSARGNQICVANALRDADRHVVMIGVEEDLAVVDLMRMYGPKNLTVIPFLSEIDSAGAYAAARVVAVPSWSGVVSPSSLRAALSESALVLSRNGYEHEYFGADAHYCDPGDPADIVRAIDGAWSQYEARKERRSALASRIRERCAVDGVAHLTETAYRRLLAYNPRREARRNGNVA